MKPILLIQLLPIVLALTLPASVRAEIIDFSWWDTRYETPGLFSSAAGGYSRDARFPDEAPSRWSTVVAFHDEPGCHQRVCGASLERRSSARTSTSRRARNATSGRTTSQTRTLTTGFAESEDRQYFDSRSTP